MLRLYFLLSAAKTCEAIQFSMIYTYYSWKRFIFLIKQILQAHHNQKKSLIMAFLSNTYIHSLIGKCKNMNHYH